MLVNVQLPATSPHVGQASVQAVPMSTSQQLWLGNNVTGNGPRSGTSITTAGVLVCPLGNNLPAWRPPL